MNICYNCGISLYQAVQKPLDVVFCAQIVYLTVWSLISEFRTHWTYCEKLFTGKEPLEDFACNIFKCILLHTNAMLDVIPSKKCIDFSC